MNNSKTMQIVVRNVARFARQTPPPMPKPRRFVQTATQTRPKGNHKGTSIINNKNTSTYHEPREEITTVEATEAIIGIESIVLGGGLRWFSPKSERALIGVSHTFVGVFEQTGWNSH